MAVHLMRVIAGQARGRRLQGPRGRVTRPMTDRAREGLFSAIAAHVPQADVLDLFAGSGSLGLEALSRGAASVVFVERDRAALDVLAVNIAAVGLGGEVIAGDVDEVLAGWPTAIVDRMFDLAFVDPPYADSLASVEATLLELVPFLATEALVIVHRLGGQPRPRADGLAAAGERTYGTATLWRYVKEST